MGQCLSSHRAHPFQSHKKTVKPAELPTIPTSPRHRPIVDVGPYLSKHILEGGARRSSQDLSDPTVSSIGRPLSMLTCNIDQSAVIADSGMEWDAIVSANRGRVEAAKAPEQANHSWDKPGAVTLDDISTRIQERRKARKAELINRPLLNVSTQSSIPSTAPSSASPSKSKSSIASSLTEKASSRAFITRASTPAVPEPIPRRLSRRIIIEDDEYLESGDKEAEALVLGPFRASEDSAWDQGSRKYVGC